MDSHQRDGRLKRIFYLLFTTNLLINLDHGIIPAASITIEKSLGLTDDQLGVLGSLVYAGIVVVGLLAGPMFIRFDPIKIIIMSILGMMASLVLFTLNYVQNYPYYILRFFTGIFQAPLLVYFPVWVDNFGGNSKTIWLTLLQGGVPFGVFTGYVLSSVISQAWNVSNWQWSFYFQVMIMAPCLFGFLFVRRQDFDIRTQLSSQVHTAESPQTQQPQSFGKESYFGLLRILFRSKVYIFVMLAMGVLYFTVTGIQFWISNYMEKVLGKPQKLVNTVFSIVSITAPTIGCILGGALTQYVGGYESKQALPICLACAILGCGSALPVPFVTSFWTISACIWSLLFFGGAMVPGLTGIMICSVESGIRSFANSTTTTFINLFGYLPAPSVYGFLSTFNEKAGITFLMIYPSTSIVLLTCALWSNSSSTGLSSQIRESTDLVTPLADSDEKLPTSEVLKPRSINQTQSGFQIKNMQDVYGDVDQHNISQQVFEYHTVTITPPFLAAILNDKIIGYLDESRSQESIVNHIEQAE